ncbi:MAG TPA: hypothetical protein VK849_10560 [Longimicrobiales bacterium]|nr:hypothetical protein [Longimicrobiales bacterium]
MDPRPERRRSVAFLDHEEETWACFLVTYPDPVGRWKGFLSFRPGNGSADDDDVRTADIFLEDSEAEIHEKARGLGRPLLGGLLSSALHRRGAGAGASPRLRKQFRDLVVENARELSDRWSGRVPDRNELAALRSLYASYRLDQVAHLISLVEPDDFVDAVDRILDGERIDFRPSDRIQFAMMVVERIETLLPLPPFDVWAADYLERPETYEMYTHALHREGVAS